MTADECGSMQVESLSRVPPTHRAKERADMNNPNSNLKVFRIKATKRAIDAAIASHKPGEARATLV